MDLSKAVAEVMLSMKSCSQSKDKISGVQAQVKGSESPAQHFVLREKKG